jgi:hypothetical protein
MYALLNRNFSTRSPLDPLWFNETNGNSGNYYIAYSIEKLLGLNETNTAFFNSPGNGNSRELLRFRKSLCDISHVILVLQDYLRETYYTDPEGEDNWYDSVSRYVEAIDPHKTKLIVMSLCANSIMPFPQPYDTTIWDKLTPIKRHLFELLGDRAFSIGTRGHITERILCDAGLTNVKAVGCPSNFEMGPGRLIRQPFLQDEGKTLRIGLNGKMVYEPITERVHHYVQGDDDMNLICQLHNPTSDAYLGGLTHFFMNPDEWKRHISKHCHCMVGTRCHGSVIAMNAGVPAITTNTDMRSRDACDYMGIPLMPGEPLAVIEASIREMFERIDVNRINRNYLCRYNEFSAWCASFGMPLKKGVK